VLCEFVRLLGNVLGVTERLEIERGEIEEEETERGEGGMLWQCVRTGPAQAVRSVQCSVPRAGLDDTVVRRIRTVAGGSLEELDISGCRAVTASGIRELRWLPLTRLCLDSMGSALSHEVRCAHCAL
jgi:hypothetical protein